MKHNYELAYSLIREKEGGYANRSKRDDPGGETNFGVTYATYQGYRKRKGLPPRSVRFIEQNEVAEIYEEQYARPVWFDALPSGIDYFMFDFAIHSGAYRAVKTLQRVVGVTQDGVMGNQTLGAVEVYIEQKGARALFTTLWDERLKFLTGLKNWRSNAKGWKNRMDFVRKNALFMIHGEHVAAPRDDIAPPVGEAPAMGEQTLAASVKDSKRSQAAVAGGASVILAAAGEAVSAVEPVREAFAWSQYAPMIGLVLAACAFAYIIWHRSKSDGYH